MPVTKERKQELTKAFGTDEKDTGRTEVQIALLTERINMITGHLKINKKDNHTRYGLLKLVGQRRSLLDFLRRNEIGKYRDVIKKLGIRK